MRPLRASDRRRRLLRIPSWNQILFFIFPSLVIIAGVGYGFLTFRHVSYLSEIEEKCAWIANPPLVCAHGGDANKSVPNTIQAYRLALLSRYIDCMEIDVSRSKDGVLFALHDRDLQRMSGNGTASVGYMTSKEISSLNAGFMLEAKHQNEKFTTLEEALQLLSNSMSRVILDVKVGPPSFGKDLGKDVLAIVEKTHCNNCIIWAKNDTVGEDVINLRADIKVGYIVMKDYSTGKVSKLLRMEGASVVGVFQEYVDDKFMKNSHGKGQEVFAWTVDELRYMKKMLANRVDGIVTGQPSLLQELMNGLRIECAIFSSSSA